LPDESDDSVMTEEGGTTTKGKEVMQMVLIVVDCNYFSMCSVIYLSSPESATMTGCDVLPL